VLGLAAVKAYNYEIDRNFNAKMAEMTRTYNELKAEIATKNSTVQSAAEKIVTAPPPAEVTKNIAKTPPKYTAKGKVEGTTKNNDGSSTTMIATASGATQADISRLSQSVTIAKPSDVPFIDETGLHPGLGQILENYMSSTLEVRNEIPYLKSITLRNAGDTGWAGQYLGSYTVSANGKDITGASGSIILNSYYYENSPYFNDYMKLVLSHEYGHHYTLWHKWVDWNLPSGVRFPDSYYTIRPLSKVTTATDYSLGWQNCELEILAENYSYEYSGYGYENADMVTAYGYPSAATKTWLANIGDSSELNAVVNAAPTVAITAPASDATLSGAVNFSASATDDIGVNKVSFYIDNTLISEVTAAPYTVSLNTVLYSNGAHTLKAVASDGSLTTTATESVTLNNEAVVSDTINPTVTITAPSDNPYAWASGPLNIDITLGDDTVLSRVDVYVNDEKKQTWTAPSGNLKTVDLTYQIASADAGTYTIKFKVYDATGNFGESSIVVDKN